MRKITQNCRQLEDEGKKRKKALMEQMIKELKDEKKEMIARREALKDDYRNMKDDDPMKPYTLLKIRKIEQDLKTEFYKIVYEDEQPSVGQVVVTKEMIENEQKIQKKKAKEAEIEERLLQQERDIRGMERREYQNRETNYGYQKAQSVIPNIRPVDNNQ